MSTRSVYDIADFERFLEEPHSFLTQDARKTARLGYRKFLPSLPAGTDVSEIDIPKAVLEFKEKNSKTSLVHGRVRDKTIDNYKRGLQFAIKKFIDSRDSILNQNDKDIKDGIDLGNEVPIEDLEEQANLFRSDLSPSRLGHSKRDLIEFLEIASGHGFISKSNSRGWRTACNFILEEIPLESDIRDIDISNIAKQKKEARLESIKSSTIDEYRRRVVSAISLFKAWREGLLDIQNSIQREMPSQGIDGETDGLQAREAGTKDMQNHCNQIILNDKQCNQKTIHHTLSIAPGCVVTISIGKDLSYESVKVEDIYSCAKKFILEKFYEHYILYVKSQEGVL